MKSTNSNDENSKTSQNKSSKKSTKSRSKSSKTSNATSSANLNTTPSSNNTNITVTTPTTPTTTTGNVNPIFDPNLTPTSSGAGVPVDVSGGSGGSSSSGSRSHHKNYAGFEPRSIKIIWEQHDQSDIELSQEVCTRLAEDASYKMWELVNNIKTFARHSGGVVTCDLVNEVFRDADVPPALGAMDSAWDRVDYDGSFFFYSDKILELRDEYQREVTIEVPDGADFARSWIVEDKHVESLRLYIPSLICIMLHGENATFETALQEAAYSPLIGACYRVLLAKIIQILAYKQIDRISLRCWQVLRACAVNPYVRDVDCREEYFNLAEILICQLIGPLECIKVHNDVASKSEQKTETSYDVKIENNDIKMETTTQQQQNDLKTDLPYTEQQQQEQDQDQQQQQQQQQQQPLEENENIFKLQSEEDGTNDADIDMNTSATSTSSVIVNSEPMQYSTYFASPVDYKNVKDLCGTLGLLGAISGYFQSECIFLITRRLEKFFNGRDVNTAKEYNYIGRAVNGLIALGEYAFREFIPFTYKLKADDIPESIWNDFSLSAIYLHGPDDIFLYEWLEYVCGGDKLQPFMVYCAEFHEKLLSTRYLQRKPPTFKINSKVGVRRLEWSTIAAAMCHGDDPSKAIKPKPHLNDAFPNLTLPNLQLNRSGNIRFKFAGCRPVILKPKTKISDTNTSRSDGMKDGHRISSISAGQHDILIAKRKLLKPLTNERRAVNLSSYHYLRI